MSFKIYSGGHYVSFEELIDQDGNGHMGYQGYLDGEHTGHVVLVQKLAIPRLRAEHGVKLCEDHNGEHYVCEGLEPCPCCLEAMQHEIDDHQSLGAYSAYLASRAASLASGSSSTQLAP